MTMKLRSIFALLLSFFALTVAADTGDIAQAEPGQGITIYLDVGVRGRTERAAERMTQLHAEYFAKGWTVVDVDPYIENGDLQGFFITYVGRRD